MTVGINKLVQMFYPRAHWRAARSPEFSPRARPRAIRLCGAAAASVRIGRVDDSSGVARGAYRMLIRCSSALVRRFDADPPHVQPAVSLT